MVTSAGAEDRTMDAVTKDAMLRVAGQGNPLPQGEPGQEHEYVMHLGATAHVKATVPDGGVEPDMETFPGYAGQVQLGKAFDAATLQVVDVEHSPTCPCRENAQKKAK